MIRFFNHFFGGSAHKLGCLALILLACAMPGAAFGDGNPDPDNYAGLMVPQPPTAPPGVNVNFTIDGVVYPPGGPYWFLKNVSHTLTAGDVPDTCGSSCVDFWVNGAPQTTLNLNPNQSVVFVMRDHVSIQVLSAPAANASGSYVADGKSFLQLTLAGASGPVTWSMVMPDGCSVDNNGNVLLGTNSGPAWVMGMDQNGCYANFQFNTVSCPMTLKIQGLTPGSGLPAVYQATADGKTQLQLEADGAVQPVVWSLSVANGCVLDPSSGLLQVGDHKGHVSVQAVDASGCSANLELDLGCGSCNCTTVENNSVDIGISLGWSQVGNSAGSLRIAQDSPSASLATTASLEYNYARDDVEVISNTDTTLRQVRGPEYLADVVQTAPHQFTVSMYHSALLQAKVNSLYTFGESPVRTVTIENPNDDTNHVRVTENVQGSLTVSDYYWTGGGWNLVTGGGLRSQSVMSGLTSSGLLATTNLVMSTSGAVVSTYIKMTQTFPWGQAVVQEVYGSGSDARTNSYTYTDQGYLQQTGRGDGSWEYRVYDDANRVVSVYSSFLNQGVTTDPSLCRCVQNLYSTDVVAGSGDDGTLEPYDPRCSVTTVTGVEVARKYQVFLPGEKMEIQCVNAGAAWNDPSNLVTVTRYYQGGLLDGQVQSITQPDGTITAYLFSGPANAQTNTVLSGHPDSTGTNVDAGTRTVSIYGSIGQLLSRQVIDAASGITISSENDAYDDLKHLTNTVYLDGTSVSQVYDCCEMYESIDRDGTPTFYGYNALKQQTSITWNGIVRSNILDAAGNTIATLRIGVDGSVITNQLSAFDDAGNLLSSQDAVGNTTLYTNYLDTAGQTIRQTTYPDLSTRIETHAIDGSLLQVTGTAVHGKRYEYGVDAEGAYTMSISLNADGSDSSEWTKVYTDLAGRAWETLYADGSFSLTFFNPLGQLASTVDPDGVTQLLAYNSQGQQEYSAIDMNTNGVIDFAGSDHITRTVSDVAASHGTNVRRTRNYVWAALGSDSPLLTSMVEQEVCGLRSWSTAFGLTNFSQTQYLGYGLSVVTQVAPDGSSMLTTNVNARAVSVTRLDALGAQLSATSYGYDAQGRLSTSTDARTGPTTTTYTAADQVQTVTTPTPAPGQAPQTTTYLYNSRGQVGISILPDNTSVTNEFLPTGELSKTYGSRTYPVAYTYDYAGRMQTMQTWRNFAGNAGAATTTWNYDPQRGFLQSKTYDDGKGPQYSFTASGRLQSRTWARGINTTYGYDNAGLPATVVYNDGLTPNQTNTYDRRGRLTAQSNGNAQLTAIYNDPGQVLNQTYTAPSLNYGSALGYGYDNLLRVAGVTNLSLGSQVGYQYDAASRLQSVSDGSNLATYSYLPNSPLLQQVVLQHGPAAILTSTRAYDMLNRLTNVSNNAAGSLSSSYGYNAANQRTNQLREDGAYWVYQYDSLGQVTNGNKYFSDGTLAPGGQFDYQFDTIGNRTQTMTGGDTNGANLRAANYAANDLNELTNRDVPGFIEVQGSANSNATVTVNGTAAYRHQDYYRAELGVNNAAAPVYQTVTNQGVLSPDTAALIANALVAATPESFVYDADGNLVSDGKWNYTWDGENRLTALESLGTVPSQARSRLEFAYDGGGRRIFKRVKVWDAGSGAYQVADEQRYWYDGWNLIGRTSRAAQEVQVYAWGLDLSGSLQGAGGVGGLLWLNDSSATNAQTSTSFYAFDGNGNVLGLVASADGTFAAQYEYAPFGEVVRATGPLARNNPFRFSTKYQDDESDLLYYGYRYYNASTGRWPNRDPLTELGGANLYAYVENDPLNSFDVLGLSESSDAVLEMVQLFQKAVKACSCDKDLARDMQDTFNSYLSDNKSLNEVVKNIQEALEQAKAKMKLDNGNVNNAIDKADENEKLTKLLLMKLGGLSWKDSNHALTLIKSVAGANGIIDHIDNTLNNADALTSGDALEIFLQAGTYVSKVPGPVGQLGKFFDWYDEAYKGSKSALGRLAYSPQVKQALGEIDDECSDDKADGAKAAWETIKNYFKPFKTHSL